MGSKEEFVLPVSHSDLHLDADSNKKKQKKDGIDSLKRNFKLNLVSFRRMMGNRLINSKRLILILFVISFIFFWAYDPSGNPSASKMMEDFERRKRSGPRDLRKPLGQGKLPAALQNQRVNGGGWSNVWPFSWFKTDPKVVIILAANEGGGVLRWKNEEEWFIEKISIDNKRAYAKRHGYGLTIKDLTLAKRYSHEFREGWQKIDILKQSMREFPNAEWFWWMDLDTLIMEPHKSLEEHLFNRIEQMSERTLEEFNPLNIPLDIPYIDYTQQIDLLITQDCGGFNLGSFIMRNSDWSRLLLDVWWEPVMYEQKHMVWDHKEQDALEELYKNEAWIRSRVGFIPLRSINSFPPGACSENSDDPRYFYSSKDRDFVVNMAGCNFGRDCWGEMKYYTSLMEKLNAKWYTKLLFG